MRRRLAFALIATLPFAFAGVALSQTPQPAAPPVPRLPAALPRRLT